MASLLFVHGGDPFARQVFAEEQRGYWSAALPLLLEQYGYLDFAIAGPEALDAMETWERHDVVLVARLPEEAWTERAVRMATAGTQTLVEGPLPSALEHYLGVSGEPVEPTGSVVAADEDLRAAAEARGGGVGCSLHTAASRPIDRAESLDWTRQGVPIESRQAEAWRAAGWDARRWSCDADVEVLAEWLGGPGGKERSPAIVRSGSLVGCSFGLFAFLGQSRTCQPSDAAEYTSWPRSFGLEAMLLAQIDDMYVRAEADRARILPWPLGKRWVLNVRHDIDRHLGRDAAEEILALHREVGTSATFYARGSHLSGDGALRKMANRIRKRRDEQASESAVALRQLASDPAHEVGHHTERIWEHGKEEEGRVRAASGREVLGTSAHGDPNCFRWQGAPNLLWAERRGHLYTEFISHAHLHPHRPAVIQRTGEIRFLNVICLPHHASFDASTTQGDTLADSVRSAAMQSMAAGGMLQVMNHPDLNRAELRELLGELPSDGRLNWTAGQAADWWRRSHVHGNVLLDSRGAGAIEARAGNPLLGATMEVAHPKGGISLVSLSLEPGRPVVVRGLTPRAAVSQDPAT